jgi:ferrous iron transport protein B
LVTEKPQAVINIADAANLERNLYLSCQLFELGIPTVLALNMIDAARDRGITVDAARLEELLGLPVVAIIARSGQGTGELMNRAIAVAREARTWKPISISYGDDLDKLLLEMERLIETTAFLTDTYPPRWTAIKYIESDQQILDKGQACNPELAAELSARVATVANHLRQTMDTFPEAVIADHRYGYIKSILKQGVIRQQFDPARLFASDRIDMVVTNRFLGPLIMVAVLLGLYHLTFTYGKPLQDGLSIVFGWLGTGVDQLLPAGHLKSLLVSGIIAGVGGVLSFVPLIMLMFAGIAVLEDSGYLARVAFMMDRVFRIFGLHGSSVMAYIISGGIAGGCAVPGVMATRTLRSPKERMATLLTAPLMNCGAKLPVLALLTGTFFTQNKAQFLFLLTLLAWVVALLMAKLLRSTVLRGASTPFVMELPPYRLPTFKGLAIHTWEKTWQYMRKAGTVILAISILLWAAMTFPGLSANTEAQFELQRQTIVRTYPEGTDQLNQKIDALAATRNQQALRHSLAGRVGIVLEPLSHLAGFDWRTNIALVGGFAAKEVIISTLGTAYSLGEVDPEATTSLSQALAADPAWNPVVAMAVIVFIMFYAPCLVTVACIIREAGSWKWGVFSMAFNTIFAFAMAVTIYQVGTALGLAG